MAKRFKKMGVLLGLTMVLTACQQEGDTSKSTQSNQIEVPYVSIEEANQEEAGDIIDITEKMYVSYINEIYYNIDNYLGKTIKLEGMFTSFYDESTGGSYYFVYRTGPGCCGNDGDMCGFEFTTTGPVPEENDWIEVIGTLDEYEENGYTYLTLKDSQITIKEERGQEVVYQ